MVKKYLLTFSLAAISCLATKSIKNAMDNRASENKTEIANGQEVELQRQASIYSTPKRTHY